MVQDNRSKPRPQKEKVLVFSYGDDYLEIFGDNIDVHIQRVPLAHSREAEVTAEAVAELLLPMRFRPLYRRDLLRKSGTTRPLSPTVLQQSFVIDDCIKRLNALAEMEVVPCR